MNVLRWLTAVFAGVVLSAQAQIFITSSGTGTNTFNAYPTLSSGWSTLSIAPNAHSNVMTAEQLDLAIQTNSASSLTNVLGQSGTVNPAPSGNAIARWNTNNLNIQIRPTGNSYTLLLATLRNETGSAQYGLEVSYDYKAFVASGAYIQEEVPGFMTYYSLSGAPNSWILIPEFSTNGNPDVPIHLTARLSFAFPWPASSNLFIVWADDNAVATSSDGSEPGREGAYTIDNFSAQCVQEPLAVGISPDNQTAAQCSTATLTARPSGGTPPYSYQWHKDSYPSPVPDATNATLVLSNIQIANAGTYIVQVTDSTDSTPQTVTNSSSVGITPDTTAPVMLSALGDTDLYTIVVSFSEPIQLSSTTGADFRVQALDGTRDLTITNSQVSNGNEVVLMTAEARQAKDYQVVVQGDGIHDVCSGLSASAGSATPLAAQLVIIELADNTVWRYRDDGIDPGPDWMMPGIDLTGWSTGTAVFDGKQGSNRVYISNEGMQVPVQTQLRLTSPNYGGGELNIPSYYFRTTFNFTGDPTNSSLTLKTFFDDSGVVFLNGQEVWRRRVTNDLSDQLSFDLYCPIQPSSDASLEGPFTIPLTNILFGENLLAVCLKQVHTNSSDITMGLSLIATVTNFACGPLQVSATMNPETGILNQCGSVTLQASALGGRTPYIYQWYKGSVSSPVDGATGSTLILSSVQPADAGSYFVVVTDSTSGTQQLLQSPELTLQVIPETVPVLLGALGQTNLHTILVVFSKPISISSETGANFQIQALDGTGNLSIISSVVTNATNVLLTTFEPRELKNYQVIVQAGVDGCAGGVSAGTSVPLASQIVLIGLSDDTAWNYRADGIDPGPDWMMPGIDLASWSSNVAVFDSKRGSNRTFITLTNLGLDVPIRTQLSLTNLNYQNGQAVIPTFYFRTPFFFPGDPTQSSFSLVTFFDDSGVVFLNGEEAWRLRVTNDLADQLSFNLYCPIQPMPDASLEGPFDLPLTNVVNGQNLLGVCLKQVNNNSSDITMGLSLVATVTNFPPVVVTRPTLTVTPIDEMHIEFSWPKTGVTFLLQSTTAYGQEWTQVSEADNPSDGYHRVRVNAITGTRFFRLYKP